MTERQLKYRAGMFLILAHVFVILLVIVLFFMSGFDAGQFTTLFGIIMPMFSGYTAAIIGFLIKDRYTMDDATQRITGTFAFLFFLFPALFALVIMAAIWAQAHNAVFRNFEEFKTFLMTLESAFAIYIGLFVYSLFQKQSVARRQRRAP